MNIITYLDQERFPILEVESQECSLPLSETDIRNIEQMDVILTSLKDAAIGLAAVQIGYPKRIFLLNQKGENRVFINPVIMSTSAEKRNRPEACLSLPRFVVRTKRPKTLTLKYNDIQGNEQTEEFTGQLSQAVCHEMDHLNGKLITRFFGDHAPARSKFGMKLTPQRQKAIAKRRAKKKK